MPHLGEASMSANVSDFTFLQGVKIVDFTQFEACLLYTSDAADELPPV